MVAVFLLRFLLIDGWFPRFASGSLYTPLGVARALCNSAHSLLLFRVASGTLFAYGKRRTVVHLFGARVDLVSLQKDVVVLLCCPDDNERNRVGQEPLKP